MRTKLSRLSKFERQVTVLILSSIFLCIGILLLLAEPSTDLQVGMFVIVKIIALLLLSMGYRCFKVLNDSI